MRLSELLTYVLSLIAQMPFSDQGDLAAISSCSGDALAGAISEMVKMGLVDSVSHSTTLTRSTARYCISEPGIGALAVNTEPSQDEALATHPASREWRDNVMGRLDGLAVIYRLVRAVAAIRRPVRVRLYREDPLDATIILPDGIVLGVLRQGITAPRTSWTDALYRLFDRPLPGGLLVIASDPMRLRGVGEYIRMRNTSLPVYLTLRECVVVGPDIPLWEYSSYTESIGLEQALSGIWHSGSPPLERTYARANSPEPLRSDYERERIPLHLLPTMLTPGEKKVLDTLFDWPWLFLPDLRGILGVSGSRLSQLTKPLSEHELLHYSQTDGGRRISLSDRGIMILAFRDRVSRSDQVGRWSVELKDIETPVHWRNVSGRKSAELLRYPDHTDGVHRFVAALARSARLRNVDVTQLDPPPRAARYFQEDRSRRSILPDTFIALRSNGRICAFFLEYERSAVYESKIPDKLDSYLAYYSTKKPLEEHGVVPIVLFVFETAFRAKRFTDVARGEIEKTGVRLPLWVTSEEELYEEDPFSPVWRSPYGNRLESPLQAALFPQDAVSGLFPFSHINSQ